MNTKLQNLVNHVVFLIDKSGSMGGKETQVINFFDDQVNYLSKVSQESKQETRVSVFMFNDRVECTVYDMDVMRLPSLKGLYKVGGGTALRDATAKAIEDLRLTPTIYGDHAFLFYVITDGDERHSVKISTPRLKEILSNVSADWTITAFVPDARCKADAVRYGFDERLVSIWEISEGIGKVGETVKAATNNFFRARSMGQKAGNIFTTQDVSAQKVVANLEQLDPTKYMVINIRKDKEVIKPVVESWTQKPYVIGSAYYQLTKKEIIQASKNVLVKHKKTGKVYEGDKARELVGLPKHEIKCVPSATSEYNIFIQSSSVNRYLYSGTELIVLL